MRAAPRTLEAVARDAVGQKGGNLTDAALGPEVPDPGADRVVAQAETLADGLGGKALDKEGMQSGEAPVQGLDGFQEEAAARGILHDVLPQ